MKKIALTFLLFVTVHATGCTPRPEEDVPQIGDSLSSTVPKEDAPASDLEGSRAQTDPTRENYILPMDTTFVLKQGSEAIIKVQGPLGDGCQHFEYIDSVKDGSMLKLTFWASRPKDPNTVCTQQMQAYQKEIRVPAIEYTSYLIVQPNGSTRSFPIRR
jgi:hypothetical protein